ncbi:MAG TPA: hypothetical protein VI793_19760 [Anaerolineales bacterium]|nr:hypothetical protein [Anaerolineales bacterium]
MTALKITLHPIIDGSHSEPLYALAAADPADPADGQVMILGSRADLKRIAAKLTRLLDGGRHDGEISDVDERLGRKWITIPEAVVLAAELGHATSAPSIRRACALGNIADAQRQGRDWRMAQARFLAWLRNPFFHKRGRRAWQIAKKQIIES